MYTVEINGKNITIKPGSEPGTFVVDGSDVQVDAVRLNENTFHLLVDGRSFTAEVEAPHAREKKFSVRVNDQRFEAGLVDPYDELLHRLGMDAAAMHKVNDLRAPMPGMVVTVHIQDGQTVKSGDLLVTLEAMKMENTLKANGDGTVSNVHVKKGQAVEKNEILVSFL